MFLKNTQTGNLVEILDISGLTNPLIPEPMNSDLIKFHILTRLYEPGPSMLFLICGH